MLVVCEEVFYGPLVTVVMENVGPLKAWEKQRDGKDCPEFCMALRIQQLLKAGWNGET